MRNSDKNPKTGKGAGKRKRKKSPVAVFFSIVLSMVAIFLVVSCVGVFAYVKLTGNKPSETKPGEEGEQPVSGSNLGFLDSLAQKDMQLNILVMGLDKDETRSDVMFVAHYDSKTGQVGLLSIPRDTRVTLTDEIITMLKEENRPYEKVCKINAVHAYGGKKLGSAVAVKQVEDLLGISIDHYVRVNLDGFRALVEAIGGVELMVPQSMDYDDPVQNLHIHLKPGLQTLDGSQAEQLVRFRSYPNGDVDRVAVQQLFLKAFAKKVLSTKTIMNNLPSIVSVAFKNVDTDLGLSDALKYVNYVEGISMDNINMETLPGNGEYVGGVSYFLHNEAETQTVVNKLFFGIQPPDEPVLTDSKELRIEVANGGSTQGLAGDTKNVLRGEGYHISQVSTYVGEKSDHTRIVVDKSTMGKDLLIYFSDAEIIVDSTLLSPNTDIKIILSEQGAVVPETSDDTQTNETES